MIRSLLLVSAMTLLPILLRADATRQDWIGDYAMEHDGHPGTLHLAASRTKCLAPCTGLEAQYTDQSGSTYTTTVNALDQSGQHLAFSIAFPGNSQRFDVYLFSFDKSRFAGTTIWQGRTFGVSAIRTGSTTAQKTASTPEASGANTTRKSIRSDGTIVEKNANGYPATHRLGQCGGTVTLPSGKVIKATCNYSQVMPVIPPDPPSGSTQDRWLRGQNDELLAIIQSLLDSASYNNYLANYENPPDPAIYKQVYFRTRAIADFTTPQ